MGNIIKFDFDQNIYNQTEEELVYWKGVQQEFFDKYGKDEHHATKMIAEEIGVSEEVLHLIDKIGFSQICTTLEDLQLERKICAYSDMRVGPHGVFSIAERMNDGRKRYEGKKLAEKFDRGEGCLRELESEIFELLPIEPGQVTGDTIGGIFQELSEYYV